MANGLYDKGREGFLDGSIDWDTDTIRALLVRTSGGGAGPYYTPDLANHDFVDDIPNNADCRPTTPEVLTTPTVTAGVADADNSVFATVAAGDAIQGIAIYKWTGVEGTSRLIAWIDTGTGLPVTPNGANITIAWDSGANRIFKL
jgi:hypothetical protein